MRACPSRFTQQCPPEVSPTLDQPPATAGGSDLTRPGKTYWRSLEELADSPVFAAIEEDLRSQYAIGFYPGEGSRDGKLHRPAVSASNRKLKVHQLRTSYSLKPG